MAAQDPELASLRSGLYSVVPPALHHGELKCCRKGDGATNKAISASAIRALP